MYCCEPCSNELVPYSGYSRHNRRNTDEGAWAKISPRVYRRYKECEWRDDGMRTRELVTRIEILKSAAKVAPKRKRAPSKSHKKKKSKKSKTRQRGPSASHASVAATLAQEVATTEKRAAASAQTEGRHVRLKRTTASAQTTLAASARVRPQQVGVPVATGDEIRELLTRATQVSRRTRELVQLNNNNLALSPATVAVSARVRRQQVVEYITF